MYNTDIVIIDSGISEELLQKYANRINGLHIYQSKKGIEYNNSFTDSYGHGSAVANIILSRSDSTVFMIKAFENEEQIDEEVLIYSLLFIKNHISSRFVNLSLGLKICNQKEKLKSICDALMNQGTIIISAFDNDGCMSFPAAFDSVIGVGNSYRFTSPFDYDYVEGDFVNALAKGNLQRVFWNSSNVVLGGSSFACAYITSKLFCLTSTLDYITLDRAKSLLRENASYVYKRTSYLPSCDALFKISKAAVFPINKEIKTLLNYSDLLHFQIETVLDIKQTGHVGATLSNLVGFQDFKCNQLVVNDIVDYDYCGIDTIIIGHMDEINQMLKYDLRYEIVRKAIDNGVNVFSFDSLQYCIKEFSYRKTHIYYPNVTPLDVPQNTFGKLFLIDKPIVAIMGTSSQQGKFSLQLTLKNLLEKKQYQVGSIGTEPHSLLFDMNYVYPMGYKASISVEGYESILLLNRALNKICDQGAEIILVASQSNSIPTNYYNISSFPLKQHAFLLGVQPDIVVLNINPDDDIEYIQNTIKYIEGAVNSKVLATVLFPLKSNGDWKSIFGEKEKASQIFIQRKKKELENILRIPSYVLGENNEMNLLADLIIDYFGEENE